MKKSLKKLAFGAALTASAFTFAACQNSMTTVYGPPPEEFTSEENINEDVYGPPLPDSIPPEEEEDKTATTEKYNPDENSEPAVYGPPEDME